MKLRAITLIKRVASGRDRLGQVTYTTTTNDLIAEEIPVARSEYFTAGQLGISSDVAFKVSQFDYNKETSLKYEGEYYRIYRTYTPDDNFIELYGSLAIGQVDIPETPEPAPPTPPTPPTPEPTDDDEGEGGEDE